MKVTQRIIGAKLNYAKLMTINLNVSLISKSIKLNYPKIPI